MNSAANISALNLTLLAALFLLGIISGTFAWDKIVLSRTHLELSARSR